MVTNRHPSVAIIILNWNNASDTIECLRSVAELTYDNFITVVVDNGSSDNSVIEIRQAYPEVMLIEANRNLGFVGGNNVGLELAKVNKADYTLLLNNDTEVSPDFLDRLVTVIEADPTIGIVGPTIYYFDRPNVVWSAGGAIDWQHGSTRMLGLNEKEQGQFGEQPRPVDFVTGCALLIRMSLLDQIGVLDPRFFAYYEETEWCVRVARAGYQVLHVPTAKVWHKISLVTRESSPLVHYYMTRNRLLFLKLSQAGRRAWFNTLIVDYARTLLSWSLKPKWRRQKASQRKVMFQAIRDYRRGIFGKSEHF